MTKFISGNIVVIITHAKYAAIRSKIPKPRAAPRIGFINTPSKIIYPDAKKKLYALDIKLPSGGLPEQPESIIKEEISNVLISSDFMFAPLLYFMDWSES
ncbi:hypothetical protein [Acinetobacter baumannii]|uniref:hypothetical protein n=1 Tax=Acinetobacter baumannii TaxID=470 RepID=UPI0012984ED0|nr:hypothetical protein [Acinetobacter baumannii]MDC4147555.1 hypothetical protein [Acinetobacter baumannii]